MSNTSLFFGIALSILPVMEFTVMAGMSRFGGPIVCYAIGAFQGALALSYLIRFGVAQGIRDAKEPQ